VQKILGNCPEPYASLGATSEGWVFSWMRGLLMVLEFEGVGLGRCGFGISNLMRMWMRICGI